MTIDAENSKRVTATDDYAQRVQVSFAKQGLMKHLGATLMNVRAGYCEIGLPYREELSQQHGFFHAGGLTAIIDSAGGYAAFTMFEPDDGVLTVEFKINCIAPAHGERLIARGEVVKAGRTLTITRGEVIAVKDGTETVCALMQQTMMRVTGRANVKG
jgi:uncharacterized protein (TIGR00369 family)